MTNQNNILIRKASTKDLPDITEIYRECVLHGTASYELDPPTLTEMVGRFETITQDGFPYLVAEEDGEILGYAYLSFYRSRPAYRFTVEDSIYLAGSARGKGLGKMLLQELVKEGTRLGYRTMVAVIGGSSPASIGVHRSVGFAHCGKLTGSGYKFGQWLDTDFMELALGDGTISNPE